MGRLFSFGFILFIIAILSFNINNFTDEDIINKLEPKLNTSFNSMKDIEKWGPAIHDIAIATKHDVYAVIRISYQISQLFPGIATWVVSNLTLIAIILFISILPLKTIILVILGLILWIKDNGGKIYESINNFYIKQKG